MKLTNISNSDKHSDTFRFLARANNMSEWMWSIFFKCLMLTLFGSPLISVISILIFWLIDGTFNTNHLYRPLKIMFVISLKTSF